MSMTVFILGAGASKEAGGPLMADFLDSADELRRTANLGDDRESFDLVFKGIAALQAVHSKSALDVYNLESIFAAFEMAALFGTLGLFSSEEIQKLGVGIRRVIVRTLEERILYPVNNSRARPPIPYQDFVELVDGLHRELPQTKQDRVAVITFNYDIALDYAFHFSGVKLNYSLQPTNDRTRFQLLKLHGSLNWSRCAECNTVVPWHLEEFFSRRNWQLWGSEPKSVHLNIASLLTEVIHCGKPAMNDPVIVPPTWNKTQYHTEIGGVWAQAAKHLSEAENIIVIGYSLPDTDQFFRYLYALGTVGDTLLKRFWVFDPDTSTVRKRFEVLLGETAKARFRHIEASFADAVAMLRDHFNVKRN